MKTKISSVFFCILVIICILMLIFLIYRNFFAESRLREQEIRRSPVVQAIEKVMPSVVNLSVASNPGFLPESPGTGVGSGLIIDSGGLVLTNLHVVAGEKKITATLSSGNICQAELIAADPQNDIALLKLINPPVFLPVIPLVRPWKLLLGETVIAVGNPYGLDGTITVGILSGVNRSLIDGQRLLFTDLLQTDAAVFPGNSGGPLINLQGQMIGMNMAVRRNSPGISFALPLIRIENVLAKFLIPERMQNLDFGFVPCIEPNGTVKIAEVFPGSPAEKAGLRPDMMIEAFQNQEHTGDLLSLSRKMIRLKENEPVKIKLKGIGAVSVTPEPFTRMEVEKLAFWKLGIRFSDLDKNTAEALRYPFSSGVIVSGIYSRTGTPFRRGDILVEWNGKKISSTHDLGEELKSAVPGTEAVSVVYSLTDDPEHGRFLEKRRIRLVLQ